MEKELTQEQLRLKIMELEEENKSLRSSKDFYMKRSDNYERLLKGVKGITVGLVTLLDQGTS